ncbi:hypothetical protein [Ewingella americana]|uniref:Uncharacterized protein n=1 Tax=Ewingella americana TaxID=41202 RepID=A0A502GFX4_9GAMM|nr:hypothetical protein [Ewingella americana]TPG59896.1 hypothetical protein EAH77_15125 [Ewingella americana]
MDAIASGMREIVLKRREILHQISEKAVVYINYNGQYWKANIVTIIKHKIAFPDFRVRRIDDSKLDWISGAQVLLESEVPEGLRY